MSTPQRPIALDNYQPHFIDMKAFSTTSRHRPFSFMLAAQGHAGYEAETQIAAQYVLSQTRLWRETLEGQSRQSSALRFPYRTLSTLLDNFSRGHFA